jgi:hypothetical protein
MARDVGGVVILQATLTFIQLGGNSPWGDTLYRGRDWILNASGMLRYWWLYIPATVAVMLFGIAWNLLGDGLNDVLDPTAHYGAQKPAPWSSRIFGRATSSDIPADISQETVKLQAAPSTASGAPLQASPVKPLLRSNEIDPVLLTARESVLRGDLDHALHSYQHLIWRGRSIDAALPDLAQLIKKYPRHPQVWQTLADALVRSGDDVHAAQSYDQARKLSDESF